MKKAQSQINRKVQKSLTQKTPIDVKQNIPPPTEEFQSPFWGHDGYRRDQNQENTEQLRERRKTFGKESKELPFIQDDRSDPESVDGGLIIEDGFSGIVHRRLSRLRSMKRQNSDLRSTSLGHQGGLTARVESQMQLPKIKEDVTYKSARVLGERQEPVIVKNNYVDRSNTLAQKLINMPHGQKAKSRKQKRGVNHAAMPSGSTNLFKDKGREPSLKKR